MREKLVDKGKFLYITECQKSYLVLEDRKALAESVCKKLILASISIEKNSISYRAKKKQDPIIAVHRGSRLPDYYDEVEITGPCRMIYRPDKPLSCGAVLWIEVDPGVEVKPVRFTKV